MKNTAYLTILLITVISIFSCNSQKTGNDESKFYIAKRNFGRLSNQIEKAKLDSLIAALPYSKLGVYSSNDSIINVASKILKDDLKSKGLNFNKFIIYEIDKDSDSILVFHLNHYDYFVYEYNWEKLNSDLAKVPTAEGFYETVPPITGNVSGHEGWYKVNIESKKVEISYAQ